MKKLDLLKLKKFTGGEAKPKPTREEVNKQVVNEIFEMMFQDADHLDYLKSELSSEIDGRVNPLKSYIFASKTPGNGKTWAALQLLKWNIENNIERYYYEDLDFGGMRTIRQYELPIYVSFKHITGHVEEVKKNFGSDNAFGSRTFLEGLLEAEFLIIDDLWTNRTTDLKETHLKEYIYELFDHRYRNADKLQTIITTNCTPQEIADFYDERVMSRIKGTCKWINKGGEDQRIAQ